MQDNSTRRAMVWVYAISVVTVLAHLACIEKFGWFRDELYYLACGKHPALGYVEHPPLVGWVAAALLKGGLHSLTAVRLLPVLMGGVVTVLAAHLSIRLGARRWGPVLTALAVSLTPTYLFMFHYLSMNCFEVLVWTLAARCTLDLDATAHRSRWIAFGGLIGLGLLNKHNLVFWVAAWVLALLIVGRFFWLKQAGPWLALLTTGVILLPHFVWQWTNGFPSLEFYRNAQAGKIEPMTPTGFVIAQFTLAGPGNIALWIAGLLGLLRGTGGQAGRALGVTYLLLLTGFIMLGAKAYYLVPFYPVLFAAGGASLEETLERWSARNQTLTYASLLGLEGALGLVAMPLAFPIASVRTTLRWAQMLGQTVPKAEKGAAAELPQHLADMFGWDTLVSAVARARDSLPADERVRVRILTSNYGQAGAIDWLGAAAGLPQAHSPHNAYHMWGPPLESDGPIILVGQSSRRTFDYSELFSDVQQVSRNTCAYCMPFERGAPIYLCRGPKRPLAEVWPRLKRYF